MGLTAVYYHADAHTLWNAEPGMYAKLAQGFRMNVDGHCDEVVHLTVAGCPGWGSRNVYFVGLDPWQIMKNRETCFWRFLASAPNDERVYWFTEPDARISDGIPPLDPDLDGALLYRNDDVHITPSFRLLRKSGVAILQWLAANFGSNRPDWHGDSVTFNALYEEMGRPELGRFEWQGLRLELRRWEDYTLPNGKYVRHYKWKSKRDLVGMERERLNSQPYPG